MEGKALKEKSRVEQFERIRRDHRDEGLSVRALAARHRVHRRTVRQALADAVPPAPKAPVRVSPALGPHEATVRGWLLADLDAPRKQRHTARRVWQRLIEEQGAQVAESSVRALVAALKVEVGLDRRQVSVPQTHPPGVEAEVDFGEFRAVIAGVVVKLWMFVLRLSHSGKAVHVAYANQAQESFLDGHVRAFAALGGVPTGMIRYDNLTPAVVRVLLGRARWENERFVGLRVALRLRLVLLPARDRRGAREGRGRGRDRPVPPPAPDPGPARRVAGRAERGDGRRRRASTTPGGSPPGSRPSGRRPPASSRRCGRCRSGCSTCRRRCRAGSTPRPGSACASPTTRCPPAWPGAGSRPASARVTVVVRADGRVVAEHPRSLHKGTEDLVLDHYLEILHRKPGALAGATALAAARASGAFTAAHQGFWDAARRGLGDGPGTRALIGALLLHRTMPAARGARRDGRRARPRAATIPTSSRSRPAATSPPRPPGRRWPCPLPSRRCPRPPAPTPTAQHHRCSATTTCSHDSCS